LLEENALKKSLECGCRTEAILGIVTNISLKLVHFCDINFKFGT